MNRWGAAALAAALLAVGTLPASANHQGPTGSISGTVTDHTGAPLAGVCVEVETYVERATATTDEDGAYTVGGLHAGQYQVTFECGPWASEQYDDAASGYESVTVDVDDGEAVTGVDADLVRAASVTGRVVDDMGVPARTGVHVWPAFENYSATDRDGRFTIGGLHPGRYAVNTFMTELSDAPAALLTAGSSVSVGTITVPAVGGITGRVTDGAGAPVRWACVAAFSDGGTSNWTTTDGDGHYRLDVPRGSHVVQFEDCAEHRRARRYYGGATTRAQATRIQVAGHTDVDGVDGVLLDGGPSVSGVVTGPDGAPVESACVSVDSVVAEDSAEGGVYRWGLTDAAGRYAFTGLSAGEYEMSAQPCYSDSGLVGGAYGAAPGEWPGTPFTVGEEGRNDIDVQLVQGGVIEGTVTFDGQPAGRVCVSGVGDGWDTTVTEDDGRYRLAGLPAGATRVRFDPCSIEPTDATYEWWPNAPSPSRAQVIDIALGHTVTGIDAELDEGAVVTGIARDSRGKPATGACAYPHVDGVLHYRAQRRSGQDGRFFVGGVHPAVQEVKVLDCSHGDRFEPTGVVPVSLAPGEVTEVDVAMADSPAQVTGITPAFGSRHGGTVVSILGSNLKGVSEVRFGGTPSPAVTVVSRTQVDAVVPPGALGSVDVVAVNPAGASAVVPEGRYTYDDTASISGVSPDRGPLEGGTEVRITGAALADATAVRFGGVDAPAFVVESDSAVVATAPAAALPGSVDVQVVTPAGVSRPAVAAYSYESDQPFVTGVSPAVGAAAGGDGVTITGFGLGEATDVHFGAVAAADVSVISDTMLVVTTPRSAAAEVVDVTVTTPTGVSAPSGAARFDYRAAPVVTALSASRAREQGRDTITITGQDFRDVDAVWFGSNQAWPVRVDSPTSMRVVVPQGYGVVDVVVETPGGRSEATDATRFTYVERPEIGALSRDRGGWNDANPVVISGDGMAYVEQVTFGGVPAEITRQDHFEVEVLLPAWSSSETVDVTVTSYGGSDTHEDAYRFVGAPSITEVTPNRGRWPAGRPSSCGAST